VKCSLDTEGHYGNSAECTAGFKGATYAYNSCTGERYSIYGRNSNDFGVQQDPCDPVGNIGIFFPLINCSTTDENFNSFYSYKSPFNIDLSLVRPECEDGTVDPAKEKFMCVYNKLVESSTFKELFLDIFGGDQTQINVKFEV